MEFTAYLIVGFVLLSAALMVYLINHAIGPDDEAEPEPDPMSRILETAAEYATVEGNESMAAAARSLMHLYLLGFEHLAAGALAREVAFARGAMKDLGDDQRIELPPLRLPVGAEEWAQKMDDHQSALPVAGAGGTEYLCFQSHRHKAKVLAQACNRQAAEDRELRRCLSASLPGGLASEGNIG